MVFQIASTLILCVLLLCCVLYQERNVDDPIQTTQTIQVLAEISLLGYRMQK